MCVKSNNDCNITKNDSSILSILHNFKGVRNPIIRLTLYYIFPILIISCTILGLLIFRDKSLIYSTMLASVVITVIFFKSMMNLVPVAMGSIFGRGILRYCTPKDALEEESSFVKEDDFVKFLKGTEDSLNSMLGQLSTGCVFALILLSRSIQEFIQWLPSGFSDFPLFWVGGIHTFFKGIILYLNVFFTIYTEENPAAFFSGIILEPLIGFFLGLIAWRMFVLGIQVYWLDRVYDIFPILGHPDKCGGLEPVGSLCLCNAKILGVWGAFLGGWIIIGKSHGVNSQLIYIFSIMLFVLLVVAAISFFLPLWGVHRAMQNRKIILNEKLDKIAENINKLSQMRLLRAYEMSPEDSSLSVELERLQKIYQDNLNFPVWPFNYNLLLTLAATQAVPLLGLSGLGAPILNLIKSILEFLNQLG